MFAVTGFVYDCGVWLRLFSCSCLNETSVFLPNRPPKRTRCWRRNKIDSCTKTPAEMLCFHSKSTASTHTATHTESEITHSTQIQCQSEAQRQKEQAYSYIQLTHAKTSIQSEPHTLAQCEVYQRMKNLNNPEPHLYK